MYLKKIIKIMNSGINRLVIPGNTGVVGMTMDSELPSRQQYP
jgi:hypothetical protein